MRVSARRGRVLFAWLVCAFGATLALPAQVDVVGAQAPSETPQPLPVGPLFGADPNRPLDLRSHCSVTTAKIGERVVLTLDLFAADAVQGVFEPEVPEGFGGVVEREPPRPWPESGEAAGTWRRYRLRMIPLRIGELSVPSFKVAEDGGEAVATSRSFTIVVAATRGAADPAETEALPVLDIPFRWPPWALPLAIGALLGALVAWWAWRRWRNRPSQPVREIPVPAHVTALRALARLRKAPRATPEEVDTYYVGVSDTLRRYLEQRFGLHAPERTTEEFLAEVERDGAGALAQRGVDTELRLGLGAFLRQCDLVKFAGIDPGESTHAEVLHSAERFVERTREDRFSETPAATVDSPGSGSSGSAVPGSGSPAEAQPPVEPGSGGAPAADANRVAAGAGADARNTRAGEDAP